MKKHSLIILAIIILLVACGSNDSQNNDSYCDDPAYLSEKPSQYGPGYIVYLFDEVDLTNELSRLESLYDIQVLEIYEELNGFHADMSDDTRELIRCEESVDSVYYNEVHSTNKKVTLLTFYWSGTGKTVPFSKGFFKPIFSLFHWLSEIISRPLSCPFGALD